MEGNMSLFITAEISINHNCYLSIAKYRIDVAVDVGADAVKQVLFPYYNSRVRAY